MSAIMELDNLSLLNADLAGSGQGLMHRCRKSATAVNIAGKTDLTPIN